MPESENQQPKMKGCWVPLLIVCGGLVCFALVAGGVLLWAGWQGYQEAPKLVEREVPAATQPVRYEYSPGQEQSLAAYGPPEGFTILFYQEEAEDASLQDVRLETWSYYSREIQLTFINGVLQAEEALQVSDPGELSPLLYTPDLFTAYLSLEEVLSAAGLESYLEIPLENEYLEESQLYYGPSLSFGLKDGQLRYVEALAVTTGQ